MKKVVFLFALIASTFICEAQTIIGRQQVITLNTGGDPTTSQALLWLPDTYNSETNTYPLIIALPGIGEQGSNINLLISGNGQIAQRISAGYNPVTSSGLKYIVCTPQGPAGTWGWNLPHISNFIDQLVSKYRVNKSMVYLTGLSAGGWGIQQAFSDSTIANKVAAIVLVASANTVPSGCINIARAKIPTWIICGTADDKYGVVLTERNYMIANGYTPLFTPIPNVGHSSWEQGYDPNWSDTATKGNNFYDWLATNEKSNSTYSSHLRVVPSGATKFTALPGDTLVFNGSYSYLNNNGISGTKENPISLFMQNATFSQGLDFHDASYYHIYGTGTDSSNYSFRIINTQPNNVKGTALSFQGKSHDIEVDHFYSYNPSYHVWFKQENSCDTNIYNMDNFSMHDFYEDSAHQDGNYLMSTNEKYNRAANCNGTALYSKPSTGSNIKVYNGTVKNSQRNAINVSNITGGDNYIDNVKIDVAGYEYSLTHDEGSTHQGAGIAGGFKVNNLRISNCIITRTFLPGISIQAGGNVQVYNNTVDSADVIPGYINSEKNAAIQITASSVYPATLTYYNNKAGYSNNGIKSVLYNAFNSVNSRVDTAGVLNQTGIKFKAYSVDTTAQQIPPVKLPVDVSVQSFTLDSTYTATFSRNGGADSSVFTNVLRCVKEIDKNKKTHWYYVLNTNTSKRIEVK